MARTHLLERVEPVLLIGSGGFAGSNVRYVVETVVPSSLLATATVNVVGCLALGVILYEDIYANTIPQRARTILATGFVASFTTYSTFVIDALTTEPLLAVGYILGSYALGFAGVVAGRKLARWITAKLQPVPGMSD